jgi:hypothetical protein
MEFPSVKQFLRVLLVFSLFGAASSAQESCMSVTSAAGASSQNNTHPARHTPDGNLILEDGTPLRLRLPQTLSSTRCRPGQRIDFEVMEPVILDGVTVVPRGALAWGGVSLVETKRPLGFADKLRFDVVGVELCNAETASLRAPTIARKGSNKLAPLRAVASIESYTVTPFLLSSGHATIPAGTEIIAYINGDQIYDPFANPGHAVVKTTEVAFASSPDEAEIEVDGELFGNTPATLRLPSGDHTIRLVKKGYQHYEEKVNLKRGEKISIDARLEEEK